MTSKVIEGLWFGVREVAIQAEFERVGVYAADTPR